MSYRPIGGRRNRSAAWQWGLIGFIPGLFCGVIVMAAVVLEGTVPAYFLPTPAPEVFTTVVHVVMTPTEDPNQPTATPVSQYIVVTATPDSQPVTVAQPTPIQAASNEIVSVQVQATQVPTEAPPVSPTEPLQPADTIPEVLILVRSLTVSIPGGAISMGTTPVEVAEAVNECTRDGGTCEASYAFDSYPVHEVAVNSFQMEITEVTFDQYVAFLNVRGPDTHVNGCLSPAYRRRTKALTPPSYLMAPTTASAQACGRTRLWRDLLWRADLCEAVARLPTEAEGSAPLARMTDGSTLGATAGIMRWPRPTPAGYAAGLIPRGQLSTAPASTAPTHGRQCGRVGERLV